MDKFEKPTVQVEIWKTLKQARIALTFYREYLAKYDKNRVEYPFGIETENSIRVILGEPIHE